MAEQDRTSSQELLHHGKYFPAMDHGQAAARVSYMTCIAQLVMVILSDPQNTVDPGTGSSCGS